MSHDQSFISRILKNKKQEATPEEMELFSEIAIDMEFPHANPPEEDE